MESIRKSAYLQSIGEDARRQYIDAQSTFTAWEEAVQRAAEVRGGMYWKRQGTGEYLIRTSPSNAQKSLGPRSLEAEQIYTRFMERKIATEARERTLANELVRHQRMNRALYVGRTPQILIEILSVLQRASLSAHFSVIGTHALYAYEAAAGVRIVNPEALATQDVDLLWDTRKRVSFVTQMKIQGTSMIGLLRKVDPTFQIRQNQLYTAVNAKGFEVDIIRREAIDGDPHPLQLTEDEEDFWATQARRAGVLLSGPQFSTIVVSSTGHMARMQTISPITFCEFKRWMGKQSDRDPMKRSRDLLQADIVEELIKEFLPQYGLLQRTQGGSEPGR